MQVFKANKQLKPGLQCLESKEYEDKLKEPNLWKKEGLDMT